MEVADIPGISSEHDGGGRNRAQHTYRRQDPLEDDGTSDKVSVMVSIGKYYNVMGHIKVVYLTMWKQIIVMNVKG